LFLFFRAYNALRIGFVSDLPIHGIIFSLFFLTVAFVIAFPGRMAFLLGSGVRFCLRTGKGAVAVFAVMAGHAPVNGSLAVKSFM
jgi:hypothetical protein